MPPVKSSPEVDPAASTPEQIIATPEQQEKQRLVAFGGFVKPEMYDVFGDYDLSEVTDKEKTWMTADRLREIVIPNNPQTTYSVEGVCLNSYEFNLAARHPKKLGETIFARVMHDRDVDDERITRAVGEQRRGLTDKLTGMNEHLAKLQAGRADIRELQREAKTPGFAHKSEERMKQLTSAAWLEFQTILDVVHLQREWDQDKRDRAQASLIYYLTQGSQNIRVGHWQEMIGLSDNYLTLRVQLFSNRARQVGRILRE